MMHKVVFSFSDLLSRIPCINVPADYDKSMAILEFNAAKK